MRISKPIIFCIANLLVGIFYQSTKAPTIPSDITQWELPHENLRLDQIHFVGAHNALISRRSTTRWGTFLYAQQTWNLKEQLEHGVRVFELDLGACSNRLVLCHKQCGGLYGFQKIGAYESFAEIMRYLTDWLTEHPEEVVIILIDSRDPAHRTDMIDSEISSLPDVRKHILTQAMWDPESHNGHWPTLKWMRRYNKRLVILNDRLDDSCKHTFHHWSYVMCTPPHTADHEQSTCLRPESLKHNKPHAQLYQFNHFAGIADNRIALLYTIGSAITGSLRSKSRQYSALENKVDHVASIIDHGKKKSLARGKNPNFIMFDNVDRFISNNGLALINQWNKDAAAHLP